jgi:hypothetical protein
MLREREREIQRLENRMKRANDEEDFERNLEDKKEYLRQ